MSGRIVWLNVEVGSLGSPPLRPRPPCSLGSVVAEAPPANGCLFPLAVCSLLFCFFWSSAGFCVFQPLSVVLCLCLTGRRNLGLPAWLGQHQHSQWSTHGSADVPIRYTHGNIHREYVTWKCMLVTCRLINCRRDNIYLRKSPPPLKNVFIINSLGCLTFTLQNEVFADFDTRRLFSHLAAEGEKFLNKSSSRLCTSMISFQHYS